MKQLTFLLAVAALAASALAIDDAPPADKELIVDGSMVHDVGTMHLNITNFGLLGATPGATSTWSGAPSARWPGAGGTDHLFAAGLWVGAQVDLGSGLEPRVSTYVFEREFRASDDPLDVIYEASPYMVGGNRYPDLNPDDDDDGAEDEDPLNGLDDDLDGLIDEDYGQISDQHFRCVLRDDDPATLAAYPTHEPLGLEVTQETFQWAETPVDGMVGMRFTIRNVGDKVLESLHLGFFADPDVGSTPGEPQDDMGFSFFGLVAVDDLGYVDVNLVGARDSENFDGLLGGWYGITILNHPVDPAGVTAPVSTMPSTTQISNGQIAYDEGGDPTNDQERYEYMSEGVHDPDTIPGRENDIRVMAANGPFAGLAPGEEIVFDAAMIVAGSLADLQTACAHAKIISDGIAFDRDGDPANGEEFQVAWLRESEIPVPNEPDDDEDVPVFTALSLDSKPNPFNPKAVFDFALAVPGRVTLDIYDVLGHRVAVVTDGVYGVGRHEVSWSGTDRDGAALPSGSYMAVLTSGDATATRKVSLIR